MSADILDPLPAFPADPALDPGASPPAGAPAPYRVLARKYRPQTFDDLIGQEAMVRTLSNAFTSGRIAQAYILTGVRGVGKTTTARILARALNYEPMTGGGGPTLDLSVPGKHCRDIIESRHVDVMEMDAASHTSINDIRELIEGARYRPVMARYKVYIIDEVHMLSTAAFNGLLKTLEEPPEHVKFVFATTEIRKVPVTVLSRCQRFDLRRVEAGELSAHLRRICDQEGVDVEAEALATVARAAEGSVRDSLSLLDQAIAHGAGRVSAHEVRQLLGLADRAGVIDLFEALMRGEIAQALAAFRDQYEAGADPAVILTDLAEFTHLVTRLKIVPATAQDAALVEVERVRGAQMAAALSVRVLARAWQMLSKAISEVQAANKPAQAAEMALVRLAYAADLPTPDEALRRLKEMSSQPGGRASGEGGAEMSAGAAPGDGRAMLEQPPAVPVQTPRAVMAHPNPQIVSGPGSTPRAALSGAMTSGAQRLAIAPRREDGSAVAAAPVAALTPAPTRIPDAGAQIRLASLADVTALAAARRDLRLKHALETQMRPVHFEEGRIEIALTPGASGALIQELARKLMDWTGRRWLVSLSSGAGAPTLAEAAAAHRAEHENVLKADPLVAAVLTCFPGARIVEIRTRTDDKADLPPPMEEDEILAPAPDDEPDF